MELRAETSVFDDKLLKEDIDNAQETADNAQVIAGTTAQYFWFLEEIGSVPAGVGTGAHITNKTKEEFFYNPANGGGNLLARSNGIAIRDGLTELAYFSGTAAQIGKSNSYNSYFDAQSFQIRNGSTLLSKFTSNGTDIYLANDSANSIASFGATIRIGVNDGKRVEVNSDGVYVYNGTTQYGYFGSFARIGDYNSNNVKMDSSGVKINTSQDNVIASFGSTATIGQNANNHIIITTSGTDIYSNASTKLGTIGTFNSGLGIYSSNGVYISGGTGLYLYGPAGNSITIGSATISIGAKTSITLDSATTINSTLSSGAITSSGIITSGSNIRLKNNTSLQGANTSGAYKSLIYISGSNTVNLGSSDCATYVNGTSFSGSKSYTGSDLRLKHDIILLDDRSSKLIMSLKPFEYKWNEGQEHFYSKGKCFGLGAQEVSEIMKEVGYNPEDYRIVEETPDGYYALCYTELIPHLIYVVQKQQKEIDELKGVTK